jgi:hypothetical protein
MIDATWLLRLRARRRLAALAAQDPARAQERTLRTLLRRAAATRFGSDHGFAAIDGVEAFQARVPIRRYEDFRRDYWQRDFPVLDNVGWPGRIPYFAVSSGTTSDVQKYIPVSRAMIRSNARAMLDLLCFHLAAKPDTRLFGGTNFMLGGSTDLTELAPGVRAGDLSGIAAYEVPWWVRRRYFPPRDLALIADWERKVALLAQAALHQDIRSIGGTPSWLLLFLDRLAALRPDLPPHLASFWPNLDLLVHGGINSAPYRASFARWLADSHAETREIYAASEGVIAVQDRGAGEGMRMLLDTGLFYEFVSVAELDQAAPRRDWIATVRTDINYAILVTSCAGLFAYLLGDTVRFVELDPPRLLVTGRTALGLSAFGEHLIGEEIETAIADAAATIGARIVDFTVGPVFATPGYHLFVIEFAGDPPGEAATRSFLATLDRRLAELNQDYRDHRAGGFGMAPPQLVTAPPGSFAAWMKQRGRLGGQNKVPRVLAEPAALAGLRRFVEDYQKT